MSGIYGGREIWGLQKLKNTLPKKQLDRYLKSFEDKRDYARRAGKIWSEEVSKRLSMLADLVKADDKSMIVYNTLPWKRSGLVDVPGVQDKQVFVKDVPACGYKTVSIDKDNETKSSGKNTLDTPFYTVEFDLERGGISSLVNKKTGKELVDTNSEFVLGQFMHERFSVDNWMGYLNAYIRWESGFGLGNFGKPGMSEDIKYARVVPSDWTISIVNSDSR
ncbi:MAG: hypothetical protein GY799_27885, partial [Desulfobulbaceae bacterium]|nr:hypothetical protein [Desulfobulbaceae bacterium]